MRNMWYCIDKPRVGTIYPPSTAVTMQTKSHMILGRQKNPFSLFALKITSESMSRIYFEVDYSLF